MDVDTSFTLPSEPAPEFGDTPAIVAGNVVVDVYVNAGAAAVVADGHFYMLLGDSNFYIRDSVHGDVPASGLNVLPGAKLTLGLNRDYGGNTGQDSIYIGFYHDVYIGGLLTTKLLDSGTVNGGVVEAHADGKTRGYMELESWDGNFFIAPTGRIDNSGLDATVAGEDGGDGGELYLYGSYAFFNHGVIDASGGNGLGAGNGGTGAAWFGSTEDIYIYTGDGYLVNTGTINASGGNGANGGDAGYIDGYSYSLLYNTGSLLSNGGNGNDGYGGDGYEIYLESYYASIYNSGLMQVNGGDGANGDGGDSYDGIFIYPSDSGYMGGFVNSGPIQAMGGDGTNGNGGDGGYFYIEPYGGGQGVISMAPIDLSGGNGTGAGHDGGYGGDLYIYLEYGYDYGYGAYTQPGDVIIGGNINISGGDGANNGGNSGYIDVYNYNTYYQADFPAFGVYFVGYKNVYASGGDGASGGEGVDVNLYNWGSDWSDLYVGCGPTIWEANLIGNGGNGSNGDGGDGGYFLLENDDYQGWTDNSYSSLKGNIIMNGGNGKGADDSAYGGDGGDLYIYGYNLTKITSNIQLNGGDALAHDNDGGDGGYAEIYSTYDIELAGSFTSNGGDGSGTYSGGYGYDFYAYAGGQVRSTMSLQLMGGNNPAAGGYGGDGGYIDIFSELQHSVFSPYMNVNGGVGGAADGDLGWIYIDWTLWNGYH